MKRSLALAMCIFAGSAAAICPNWSIRRETDAITDIESCVISSHDSASNLIPMVLNDQLSFSIAGRDYPGRSKYIRVDDNKAFQFGDHLMGEEAQQLLAQIRTGKVIRTRFTRWPSGAVDDNTFEVCGLPQALDACLKPVAGK